MFNDQKGFTLIELMVVVVIIGILAAIALPNFLSMQDRAKEAEVKANMHSLQLAVEDYKTQNNGAKPLGSNGSFVTGPAPATPASGTVYVPSNMKNPFAAAGTITGAQAVSAQATAGATSPYGAQVSATPTANVNSAGNVGYNQDPLQTNPYFIAGWSKKGTVLPGQLSEGQ